MTECGTNIVDCLREKGINPLAHASSLAYDGKCPALNAISYDVQSIFHSNNDNELWWKADFKRVVTVHAYQIGTDSYCNYLRKWRVMISNDNETWKTIDSPPEESKFPMGKIYVLKKMYSCRFFRINKLSDSKCGSSFAMRYVKFFGSINNLLSFRVYRRKANRCFVHFIISMIYS